MTAARFGPEPPADWDDRGPADVVPPPPVPASDLVTARHTQLAAAVLDDTGLSRIPAPAPLVDRWLFLNSIAWLHGKPGHGKSFVAVDLACSVGTGTAWHSHDTTPGPVLYLIAEGASGLGQRVEAWKLANGAFTSGVQFLPIAVQLLSPIDLPALLQLLATLKPILVIVDTQARATVGADENSAKDMGELVDALERIRQATGACVLVVHHEARAGENMRGSTALEGAATSIIRCTKDGPRLTLTNSKQKDSPEQPDQILALAPIGASAVVSHDAVGLSSLMTDSERDILATLRDQFGTQGTSTTRLLEATGIPKATFYRALSTLKTKGLITEQRVGRSPILLPASLDGQEQVPLVSTSPTHPGQ